QISTERLVPPYSALIVVLAAAPASTARWFGLPSLIGLPPVHLMSFHSSIAFFGSVTTSTTTCAASLRAAAQTLSPVTFFCDAPVMNMLTSLAIRHSLRRWSRDALVANAPYRASEFLFHLNLL